MLDFLDAPVPFIVSFLISFIFLPSFWILFALLLDPLDLRCSNDQFCVSSSIVWCLAKAVFSCDISFPLLQVGVQHLPPDLKMKMDNLVQVNAVGNQIRARHLPRLPRQKQLTLELAPIFSRLSSQSSMAERHPVYKCNDVQAEAAGQFLVVLRRYMDYLCADLRSYTITNVQSNNDRVSILLKDTFVESFSSSDQPFIKLFVDTQLFTVLTDSRLSSFENEF
ncbi:hypothetical protein Leryth_000784 [Lithospermum erythrorhizon]|nr:hypothetical protein Leryth_000784 [Lithospermum erythrorhizon]